MVTKTKLSNGLTLVLAPLKATQAVTVLVLAPVGSRYEAKNINGVSHFVEHLLFKGTTRRPTSLDITKELDAIGAEYNAFTAKDHTGYYIKTISDKVELAFDVLADMIFESTFKQAEIDKERGVILEEINMYDDNPLMNLGSLFDQTVFGDHPLGWNIAGPKSVIKKVSRREIVAYKNKHYRPQHIIIAVSGNFNAARVKGLAKRYFGNAQPKAARQTFDTPQIKQQQPRVSITFKDTQQVQLGLGFPAYGLKHPKLYALYLLSLIMGGNMSSRLFTVVREQHGLAYYIRTDASAYQDTGTFMVQAGLDKKRIKQAISLILSELARVRDGGVTDKELSDAKAFLKGKIVLELEDSEHVADWYGKQQLFLNTLYTPEQRLKKIQAMTKRDISAAARDIIKQQSISLALIGPFKDKKLFTPLLRL